MDLQVYRPPDAQALWRISSFGRQRVPAGQPYRWENAGREPRGLVVAQYTLAGRIAYRDARGERAVGPGDLLLFAYDEPSMYGVAGALPESYRCHWLCLQGAGLLEHVTAFRARFGSVRPLGPNHPLGEEIDALVTHAGPPSPASATAMAAAVHTFIMRLFEEAEQSHYQQLSPAQRAVEHVLRQPQGVLSLDGVARRFGCSREHLGRLFAEQVGQSPAAYLNDVKTRRALRLLRETDLPLDAVAAQAGFPTVRTMSRHVRGKTGLPPGELRADQRRSM